MSFLADRSESKRIWAAQGWEPYRHLTPEDIDTIRLSVLDRVLVLFETSSRVPENASFMLGAIAEALHPYRKIVIAKRAYDDTHRET